MRQNYAISYTLMQRVWPLACAWSGEWLGGFRSLQHSSTRAAKCRRYRTSTTYSSTCTRQVEGPKQRLTIAIDLLVAGGATIRLRTVRATIQGFGERPHSWCAVQESRHVQSLVGGHRTAAGFFQP